MREGGGIGGMREEGKRGLGEKGERCIEKALLEGSLGGIK